jgi:hypothetical protein
LPPAVARAVQAAASHPRLVALATKLSLPPVVLVLVMLADSERDTSRAAARFAQAVLGNPTGWILFARAALRQIARQEFGL